MQALINKVTVSQAQNRLGQPGWHDTTHCTRQCQGWVNPCLQTSQSFLGAGFAVYLKCDGSSHYEQRRVMSLQICNPGFHMCGNGLSSLQSLLKSKPERSCSGYC